jgi:hypothetical protein
MSFLTMTVPLSTPDFGSKNLNACPEPESTTSSRSRHGAKIPAARVSLG